MAKPIIFMDVDGVLSPWLKEKYGPWLQELNDIGTLVWASNGWHEIANEELSPLFGLPELPKIKYDDGDKVKAMEEYDSAKDRPVCLVDDEWSKNHDVILWAQKREGKNLPTLLVAPAQDEGLRKWHVEAILKWAEKL